jgi:hypothetical protein
MKTLALIIMLLVSKAVPAQTQKHSLDSLAWLAGCWHGSSGGRSNVEQWMKPSGHTMLGMGRTVANGKTVEYEFLRLHEEPNGDIFYTALPSGQQEASFKLVKLENHSAVFENPDHDFPQRIIYTLEDDGSLKARIEGKSKGKERGIDYPMKRGVCE